MQTAHKILSVASLLAFILVPRHASALEKKLATTHYAQEESWSCGVSVARMWCKFISPANTYTVASMTPYTGQDGTNIPELINAVYNKTPAGYYFAEWEYYNNYEAVKGIVWTLEKLDQPVAIAGKTKLGGAGGHYYLVRGYKGTHVSGKDGYAGYPNFAVQGIYVEDSVYLSTYYGTGLPYTTVGQYALSPNTLITSESLTATYWTKTGGIGDKKYRSVERVSDGNLQGATLENNVIRNSY
jgi:hypothetical protein